MADGLGSAGTPQDRAQDLHECFVDPDVQLVLTTIGGYTSNTVLDSLDFTLLRKHPTWLCGYSDVTAILVGLWTLAGVQSIMGPAVLPQFGDHGGCDPDTWLALARIIEGPGPWRYQASNRLTTEVLAWDSADSRSRASQACAGALVLRGGSATGTLLPVNLDTLMRLAGTRYWPSLSGVILMLEQSEATNPALLTSLVAQLRQVNALSEVRAIAFGRFPHGTELDDHRTLQRVVDDCLSDFLGPIVCDVEFGHTDPQVSLVCGGAVELQASGSTVSLASVVLAEDLP